MSIVSGFFNSDNGDRKYNADHFGKFFDGLIRDGVYVNFPEKNADGSYTNNTQRGFYTYAGEGVSVCVAPGRCFFNHYWMYNDAVEVIDLSSLVPTNSLSKKLITIFIDVNTAQSARQITLRAVAGTEVANDNQHTAEPPTPIETSTRHQYPIAIIAMFGTTSQIAAANVYPFDAKYTDYRKTYFAKTVSVEALLEYSSRTRAEIYDEFDKVEKPAFTEATSAVNLNSGENYLTLWGKIKKFMSKLMFATGGTSGQVWKVKSNGQADWTNDWGLVSTSGAGLVPKLPADGQGVNFLGDNGQWCAPASTVANAEKVNGVVIKVQSGKYGYMDGSTFKPFKDPTGTAAAGDVLSGKTFANAASDTLVTGTMPNNGTVTKSLNTSITSYTIPKGYHSGSGKVSLTLETKTVTASRSAQTVTPSSGKVLSKVTVNKYPDASGTYTASSRGSALDMGATNNLRYVNTNGVPNSNSGTYTFGSNDGSTKDLGTTNTYRYVNAQNVYSKGHSDGETKGYNSGYTEGYNAGNSAGYSSGRAQGHADERGIIIQLHLDAAGSSAVIQAGWRYGDEPYTTIRDMKQFSCSFGRDTWAAYGVAVKYNDPPMRLT